MFKKSKKKIYVSSSTYNLAGDIDKRPNILETTLVNTLFNPNIGFAEGFTNSYLTGPQMKLKAFGGWANKTNYYASIGVPAAKVYVAKNLDFNLIGVYLPKEPYEIPSIQNAEIEYGDAIYWATQWMMKNHPDLIETDWLCDIDEDGRYISIEFEDGTSTKFLAEDFDVKKRYLYVTYNTTAKEQIGAIIQGLPVKLDSHQEFPSTVGWTKVKDETVIEPTEIQTRLIVRDIASGCNVSDNVTVESTETVQLEQRNEVWKRSRYVGNFVEEVEYMVFRVRTDVLKKEIDADISQVNLPDGSRVTRVTRREVPVLQQVRFYQIDTQKNIREAWGETRVFIYKEGSGNTSLDSCFDRYEVIGKFYPFVPVRIYNQFVSGNLRQKAAQALQTATGGKLNDIISKLRSSPSLGDIDHAYIVFGVSLSSKEMVCQKYLYHFFKNYLMSRTNNREYDRWDREFELSQKEFAQWQEWRDAQNDPSNPLYGSKEPSKTPLRSAPSSRIHIASSSLPYIVDIAWNRIVEVRGTGKLSAKYKVGDVWTERSNPLPIEYKIWLKNNKLFNGEIFSRQTVTYCFQETEDTWSKVAVSGLMHVNTIYKGKGVVTDGMTAFSTADEESAFIIPLMKEAYEKLNSVDAAQLTTGCVYLVLNSYQVVKKKWYQSGFFKIIMIVVIIIVSIWLGPVAGAGISGVLGTAATVGATLGFAGTAAIIAGSIANVVAGALITQILTSGATSLFGDKFGQIIGAIASIAVLNIGTNFATGNGFTLNFGDVFSAPNLLKVTNSVGEGISLDSQQAIENLQKEAALNMSEFARQSAELDKKFKEMFGDNGNLDPLTLMAATTVPSVINENVDTFLARTLLTGGDIANMSLDAISNFVATSLDLELR